MVVAQGGVVVAAEEVEGGAVFALQAGDGGADRSGAVLCGGEEGRGDAAEFGAEQYGFCHVNAVSDAAAGDEDDVRVGGAIQAQRFDGGQPPVLVSIRAPARGATAIIGWQVLSGISQRRALACQQGTGG